MKKLIYIILICVFNIQASEQVNNFSNNYNIAGTYQTDFGEMHLRVNGDRIKGTYKHREGKIEGVLKGNKLTGTWTQTNGKGKIIFIFNSDFSKFTGKWGSNDSSPNGKWNGTKIGSSSSTGTSPSSSASSAQLSIQKKHFQQNENIVVSFTTPAGLKDNAWIGIIPSSIKHGDENVNDQHDVSYQYLNKKASGTLTFKAPPKNGSWDLRMNSADGGGKELTSISFTVGDVHSDPINQPPVSSQPIVGNEIFNNGNISGVSNGAKSNTYFYVVQTTTISSILNYHWNSGNGSQPGQIGLRDTRGSILGTWQSKGSNGMRGVKNANWTVYPNITLQPGIYLITDSEPSTWSQNNGSYGAGFSIVNAK